MKNAFLFYGGWDGHKPLEVAERFSEALRERDIRVTLSDSLEPLADTGRLKQFDVIIPCWTMGTITPEQSGGLQEAVRSGVGLAGIHGGMGDAFRGNIDYEWMVGGHFVGHPHVGPYTVSIRDREHPATTGLPAAFDYRSEQYYLMVDPGIQVLAETDYEYEGRRVNMPVAWTKSWGQGRVFYSALGHDPAEFDAVPESFRLAVQGIAWAAR